MYTQTNVVVNMHCVLNGVRGNSIVDINAFNVYHDNKASALGNGDNKSSTDGYRESNRESAFTDGPARSQLFTGAAAC